MNTTDRSAVTKAGMDPIEISDPAQLPSEPLVSVYMLTYNHGRYITEAIEGVVAQHTNFPIELIIGEDCSIDTTGEIVRAYQKRYPKLIRILTSEHNVGMHANGVRCEKACRGEFIALCEGDDYWHNTQKLQMQVDAMQASPETTMCHTDYNRQIGTRIIANCHERNQSKYLAKGDAFADLLHTWTVKTVTSMYRRNIINDFVSTVFNDTSWPFGDYNRALYASVRGKIAYLPISTATWRKVRGSATNTGAHEVLRMRLASLACRELFIKNYYVDDDIKRECLSAANKSVMKYAFFAGNMNAYDKAYRNVIAMGCNYPNLGYALTRTLIRARFPIKVIDHMRKAKLRLTTMSGDS